MFEESVVLRLCCKDGAVIRAETNNVPVTDDSGTMVAIEGITRNITERKTLEQSMRDSNEMLTAFLHISRQVSAAAEMESLLQQIVDSVAKVTNLRNNAIYVMCDQNTNLPGAVPSRRAGVS